MSRSFKSYRALRILGSGCQLSKPCPIDVYFQLLCFWVSGFGLKCSFHLNLNNIPITVPADRHRTLKTSIAPGFSSEEINKIETVFDYIDSAFIKNSCFSRSTHLNETNRVLIDTQIELDSETTCTGTFERQRVKDGPNHIWIVNSSSRHVVLYFDAEERELANLACEVACKVGISLHFVMFRGSDSSSLRLNRKPSRPL
ncbi:hypothetical protein GYMLUDRAFT_35769 [Collybiopsis luxurians FD-317 M1]|nr:hypothetical protein GYMLUDRAFT_35769 [Collybiopsis luxurians FD-317 M1]